MTAAENLIAELTQQIDTATDAVADANAAVSQAQNRVENEFGWMQDHLDWINANRGANASVTDDHPFFTGFLGAPTSSDTYIQTIQNSSNAIQNAKNALTAAQEAKAIAQQFYDDNVPGWKQERSALTNAIIDATANGASAEVASQEALNALDQQRATNKLNLILTWGGVIIGGIVLLTVIYALLKKYKVIGKRK